MAHAHDQPESSVSEPVYETPCTESRRRTSFGPGALFTGSGRDERSNHLLRYANRVMLMRQFLLRCRSEV